MKVNAKEFYEAIRYIAEINSCEINSLDLSEFKQITSDEITSEFKSMAETNKEFIVSCYAERN